MTDDIDESEFWSATEQLKLIYQWARASYVAPWALLVQILGRVLATTGPHVMLPGPPAPASLNMGVVLVGRSGAGKGITDKLSRVVWPADIHEEGLGSGQGVAELFKEQKNPEDRVDRALITASEIDHLTALNAGQGNNTRAAVKAALTGDRLGSKGASAATTRAVPADSYRLFLSISAQFGHCAVLLDDVSGGTPQRQVWMLVTDPDMPKELGPTPDRVLDTALPSWALTGGQVLIQYGPPEIREYINAGLWASGRGAVEAIDGHRTLTRLKVAAALAILDHRMVISAADWELSEVIMAKSDATRNSVLEYDRQAARAKVRERAVSRAAGEDFYDASRLETVKRSIMRMLERDGEQQGNVLRSRLGRKEKRELFDQAVGLLEAEGLVSSVPGLQKGTRYRLGGQGDHGGQGEYSQVKDPDHLGRGDHPATVTELNTRRSECPNCRRTPARADTGRCTPCTRATMNAGEFLVCWIRVNGGPGGWVKPGDAIDAGAGVGYTIAALKAARSRHSNPRMEASGDGRGSMWRIAEPTEGAVS
ncbi:hypothetical protein [Mycolicibacterium mengxianglii]|uniref:hypothetical protein n=1 Tax=Mycolicibacterium mengxianglii TaxID=2736649 RepID=UPI0018D0D256|nr:hypothetical protein [Mycolicibacterium mengxianglii]